MPDNLFPEEYDNDEEYLDDEENEGTDEENTEEDEDAGYKPSIFFDVRLAAHVSNGLKSRIRPVVGRI